MARSRTFACELYPEDETHMKILEEIKKYYDYAYILHDKDKWEEETVDSDGITIHKVGDIKKPHYHVVISFQNARSIDKIKKDLNLKHIETCNFYFYIRYLIHKDNPKKYQYNECDIETNMPLRVENALIREYNSQEQDARILINFIKSKHSFITFMQLIDFAIENDCLSEVMKRSYFYKNLCDDIGFRRY